MIVSKAEFARLSNVSKGRVTQWISEGKINGAALVGEGRAQRIVVDRAHRQIGIRRDMGQTAGNGLRTRLRGPAGPSPDGMHRIPPTAPEEDPLDAAIKRQRLMELEARNRRITEEEAERQGRYVLAKSAKIEMTRLAEDLMRHFEGAMPELAATMAAKFELEYRDVLHVVRTAFVGYRTKVASKVRERAADLPELVGDEGQDSPAPDLSLHS